MHIVSRRQASHVAIRGPGRPPGPIGRIGGFEDMPPLYQTSMFDVDEKVIESRSYLLKFGVSDSQRMSWPGPMPHSSLCLSYGPLTRTPALSLLHTLFRRDSLPVFGAFFCLARGHRWAYHRHVWGSGMKTAQDLESCTCCGEERPLPEQVFLPPVIERREEYVQPLPTRRPVLA